MRTIELQVNDKLYACHIRELAKPFDPTTVVERVFQIKGDRRYRQLYRDTDTKERARVIWQVLDNMKR